MSIVVVRLKVATVLNRVANFLGRLCVGCLPASIKKNSNATMALRRNATERVSLTAAGSIPDSRISIGF